MQEDESNAEKEIHDRITAARGTGDMSGIVRGLHDLESIGWEDVCLKTHHIGRGGERLVLMTWVNREKIRVFSQGLTRAFRLIWLLRFREMIRSGHYRYIKHENDMSPEEYEWVQQSGSQEGIKSCGAGAQ